MLETSAVKPVEKTEVKGDIKDLINQLSGMLKSADPGEKQLIISRVVTAIQEASQQPKPESQSQQGGAENGEMSQVRQLSQEGADLFQQLISLGVVKDVAGQFGEDVNSQLKTLLEGGFRSGNFGNIKKAIDQLKFMTLPESKVGLTDSQITAVDKIVTQIQAKSRELLGALREQYLIAFSGDQAKVDAQLRDVHFVALS